jgi:hypothetical protein
MQALARQPQTAFSRFLNYMKKEDFELFKQKYASNCKTKSANEAVLEVYAFLLENENTDSDYWTIGNGNHALVTILEYKMQDDDWSELESDLSNWTIQQLDIFAWCITSGEGIYDIPGSSGGYYDRVNKKSYPYQYSPGKSTVNKRINLLSKLISISNQQERQYNEISRHIYDNLDILMESTELSLDAIDIEMYNTDSEKDELMLKIKNALEKASR